MPLSTLKESTRTIDEETTFTWTVTVNDETATAVPSANIDAVTCDLYNHVDGATINSRTAQDVFNTNNCTFHATSGLFTWTAQKDDNQIIALTDHVGTVHMAIASDPDDHGWLERHWAVFNFNWSTSKWSRFALELLVRQLPKVT